MLDVGGWDFHQTAVKKGVAFDSWTVLEVSRTQVLQTDDARIRMVLGDGGLMGFAANSFDTVLNVQVLEPVFDPLAMLKERVRILRNDGRLIPLIPQTATLHMVPHHYYNFTRFWIREALRRAGEHLVELQPLGGVWSSMASYPVHFSFQSLRFPGMSTPECKRGLPFYLLYPFMVLFALFSIPICLLLSIGDLTEEPNNYSVIASKPPMPRDGGADGRGHAP